MKIDEFGNNQEVNEGFQDVSNAVIGKRATSAIKGMFTGNKDQRVQDEFVRDFLTTVGPRLKQSISTGIVRLPPATMPTAAPVKEPAAPAAPTPAAAPAAAPNPRKDAAGNVPYDDITESHFYKYDKLNALFESIIEASEPEETTTTTPPTDAQSISAFLSSWFTKYMQGYDWTAYKPQFDALFKEVENTYRQNGGKAALTKLAKAAYSITGATGGTAKPGPVADTTTNTKKASDVAPTGGGGGVGNIGAGVGNIGGQAPMSAAFVQAHLDALKTSDPKGYAAIVRKIINEYKKAFAARNSKKAAAPTPPPVPAAAAPAAGPVTKTEPPAKIAESRRRRYPKL